MLHINGLMNRSVSGITRRELMQVGGLSLLGMNWKNSAQAAGASVTGRGPAKSVIMFNLLGGPSHIDMFDLKPHAAVEIRGEFSGIDTTVPGLQICEHLPNLARWMHRGTLIRTFSHMFNSHDPLPFMTGFTDGKPSAQAMATDPPDMGLSASIWGWGPMICRGRCACRASPDLAKRGTVVAVPMADFWARSTTRSSRCASRLFLANQSSTTTTRYCRSGFRSRRQRMPCPT